MNLEMDEFEFISAVSKLFPKAALPRGWIGIGQDAAVFPGNTLKRSETWVATTDALSEGIHFLKLPRNARAVGWKAIAVNLSDLAAMGARPVGAFLSISLPPGTSAWALEFMKGVRDCLHKYGDGIPLLGGDTTGSLAHIQISVTLLGARPAKISVSRSGARPGDLVFVTGSLGASRAGLAKILKGPGSSGLTDTLVRDHYRVRPALDEGAWLASRVSAMTDLSDGLATDLIKLGNASSVGFNIDLAALPVEPRIVGHPLARDWAYSGGEDYGLLFCVREARRTFLNRFVRRFPTTRLTAIGIVTQKKGIYCQTGPNKGRGYRAEF